MIKPCLSIFLFILAFLSGNFNVNAETQMPAPFRIIPQPQEVELLNGSGLQYGELEALVLEGDFKRPVMGNILSCLTESGNIKGTLTLKLDSSKETLPNSEEGYVLTISGGKAEITSRGEAGLFYGCQTLEQHLEDARDFNARIPACKITDYPELAYRAVHVDVKHHLDHMNYYYESIDRLAKYKINGVIFEFEDKLRYRRQPLVGAPQAISIDEMAALTKYARERHIDISPLVQGLGHATFILKHPEYANLRELEYNRWAFCPLNEGTYQVLFDMYRDAMEATPGSKYLHVGGDEVGVIGLCSKCKPVADKEGESALYFKWLNRVCEFVKANGRTPMFWSSYTLTIGGVQESTKKGNISLAELDEIWQKGKPVLERIKPEIPKNCISLRGGANYMMARQPGNIRAIDWFKENGFRDIPAIGAQSGLSALFPLDDRNKGLESRGIAATESCLELASEKGIDGMLCTSWDDTSPHMETFWRGFIASAEYSWSPGKRTLEEYDLAYLQREYGTTIPEYSVLYGKLRSAALYWEKAFNQKGNRLDLENTMLNAPLLAHWLPPKSSEELQKNDFTKLLIELPDLKNPGQWSEKYAVKLDVAKQILEEYHITSIALSELYKNSKKNRYHWKLFSAVNDFQVTAPKLLLALEQCDTADPAKRRSGIEKVNRVLDEFDKVWDNLKSDYSETRFIANPVNYVPDRYFHFANLRNDLSWMIQVEEVFHKEIKQWLNNY